jgi:ParB-like chromosome segregation protein Spo0J
MSDLTVEIIGIDTVEPHPDNARVGDVSAIAESLERFGQVKPIVVQKSTGYVVAGNHTRMAAVSLGWEQMAAVLLDIDDETAKAYLLADNRLSDRAKYDQAKLYESLDSLLDLDGTGYDLDYVESLGDALGAHVVEGGDTGEVVKQPAPEKAAQAAAERAEQKPKAEAMRDIVMLMTVSRAAAFGEKVATLQKAYGTRTVVDTVERAVDEAVMENTP